MVRYKYSLLGIFFTPLYSLFLLSITHLIFTSVSHFSVFSSHSTHWKFLYISLLVTYPLLEDIGENLCLHRELILEYAPKHIPHSLGKLIDQACWWLPPFHFPALTKQQAQAGHSQAFPNNFIPHGPRLSMQQTNSKNSLPSSNSCAIIIAPKNHFSFYFIF